MSWTYELNNQTYDFADAEDIQDALDGDWGSDYQRAAALVIADLESDGGNGASDLDQEQWVDGMEAEMSRLQNRLGRPLTSAEFKSIADDANPAPGVPDLVEAFGEELASRTKAPAGSEERHQWMVENYEDTKAQHELEEQGNE